MRNSFVDTVYNIISRDENTYFMTGDLGFGVLTKIWEDYPKQFINAGIAEQNMTSVAAGMALEGKCVFTYSIANFPTLRAIEQIRNCVAYHNANVKIVSIGAGFAYGGAGITHHGTEDLAIVRAIPNITVFSPADPIEAVAVTQAAYEINGPCYIRLGRGGEPCIHKEKIEKYTPGDGIVIADGNDIAIFATGAIVTEAESARKELENNGISTALCTFPTIKPIDKQLIKTYAHKCRGIITIEEHNIVGGFGSAIAEVLSEINSSKAVLKMLGLNDEFSCVVGNQSFLRGIYNITGDQIVEQAKRILAE